MIPPTNPLPPELISRINDEPIDFVAYSTRSYPLMTSILFILFSTLWLGFCSIFVLAFLGPIFVGEESRFTSNGVPTVASRDNLAPIMIPGIVIGIFLFIGFILLFFSVHTLFQPGGYFIGTPKRLINYLPNKYRSIDWEQFSGDIEVVGNNLKGNIYLKLRTGKMIRREDAPAQYVPDKIQLIGFPSPYEIERICRQRIKENDPTPAQTNLQ